MPNNFQITPHAGKSSTLDIKNVFTIVYAQNLQLIVTLTFKKDIYFP